jgi:hypothetical protein
MDPQAQPALNPNQRRLLTAQRTMGNQAVLRQMAKASTVQREEPDGMVAPPGATDPAAPTQIADGGNSVSVSGSGVSIVSSGPVRIAAPMIVEDAPTVTNQGITQTDTLIAQTVMGSSYTPGAGNMW